MVPFIWKLIVPGRGAPMPSRREALELRLAGRSLMTTTGTTDSESINRVYASVLYDHSPCRYPVRHYPISVRVLVLTDPPA